MPIEIHVSLYSSFYVFITVFVVQVLLYYCINYCIIVLLQVYSVLEEHDQLQDQAVLCFQLNHSERRQLYIPEISVCNVK